MGHHSTARICWMALAVGICIVWIGALCAGAQATYGAVSIAAAERGGRIVEVSSEAKHRGRVIPEWRKEHLIDGLRVEGGIIPAASYGWASDREPSVRDPEWAIIAFAGDRQRLVGAIRLDPRTNDPPFIGRWVKNFTLQFSTTTPEGPWMRVDSFELINEPIAQTFALQAPVRAKYLRLLITSNQGSNQSVSLGEIEVFEALMPDNELHEIIAGFESQLRRLKRFGVVLDAAGDEPGTPALSDSVIAAANGGEVAYCTSTATHEDGTELPQWQAANLIDGLVATAGEQPDHNSCGWSSDAAPSVEEPQIVAFRIPGDAPVVIDAALADTNTRDPWGTMRGPKGIEISVAIDSKDGPWKSVGAWELPLEPARHTLSFAPVESRFVRILFRSNFGSDRYVELGEFGVYRLAPEQKTIDGIAARILNAVTELKRHAEGDLAAGTGGP